MEVIVAIESDASLLVRMARTFELGASLDDITKFVRDWAERFGIKIPDKMVVEIEYALVNKGIYWWNETYCLQICEADRGDRE